MSIFEYTALDGNAPLGHYETATEAILSTQYYINDCAKCGVSNNVSIKDNKTGKVYKFEDFKKRFGGK